MANFYALISHDDDSLRDPFYADRQLPSRKLSIGWGEVNPVGSSSQKIKADIKIMSPKAVGTNNPWNGEESLPIFCALAPGDIVFVRGNAQILDIAVITGNPFYSYGKGHYNEGRDYCTMVPFVPLFSDKKTGIPTREIPEKNYGNILDKGSSRLVLRKLEEADALILLKSIIKKI